MDSVSFDRATIAGHANNLASTIQLNLKRSLESIGVVRMDEGIVPLSGRGFAAGPLLEVNYLVSP